MTQVRQYKCDVCGDIGSAEEGDFLPDNWKEVTVNSKSEGIPILMHHVCPKHKVVYKSEQEKK